MVLVEIEGFVALKSTDKEGFAQIGVVLSQLSAFQQWQIIRETSLKPETAAPRLNALGYVCLTDCKHKGKEVKCQIVMGSDGAKGLICSGKIWLQGDKYISLREWRRVKS